MCGIAGFYAKQALASSLLESMTTSLAHRGPDDQGYFGVQVGGHERAWKTSRELSCELSVGLGFRRLSILDLSPAGAQPRVSADGRYVIVFNGEIYNYLELKEEL